MLHKFFQKLEYYQDPFPDGIGGRPPNTLLAFIAYYARPFWPLILASAVLSTLIALIEVWLFAFIGELVDWLTASSRETFWQTHRQSLIAVGVLVLFVWPGLSLVYESVVHQGLLGNFGMRTRWLAHRYLLRQSVEFFQDDFAGRIAAKMMQTALGVRDSVLLITEVILYVAVYFTGAVFVFAASDWRMTFPLLLWLGGYIFAMYYFIPKLKHIAMRQADARSMVTGRVVDSYTNIATVKMFDHSQHEKSYAREGMQEFLNTVHTQMRLVTKLTAVLSVMNALLLFSVAALGIYLWQQGATTAGVVAFAVGLVLRMQGMSQWIMWEIADLFENLGVVQDGIDVIANDLSVVDREGAVKLEVAGGAIEYKDVCFSYRRRVHSPVESEVCVIENLSLKIAPGEKIGVVGHSGAGKSTLVHLLLRFYDLESGRIEIDGRAVADVTQESLRAAIGMVTQDTSLLHRSVFDNIRYGRSDVDMQAVMAAAKSARAHDFIEQLEDMRGRRGYRAHVGERGVKLSGGQRQRIAIARVLLKNAPILVLDEATSALDSEIESAIQENLHTLMQGKTVLAIAHRLSTIAAMDRLVVMENGRIVEQGAHAELVEQNGVYADLWAHQSGGFLV